MQVGDLDAVLEVQAAGAVVGLAEVFAPDLYPFPRDAIRARWRNEITDPDIATFVAVEGRSDRVVGFAATRFVELLHFGIEVGSWGTGLAGEFLAEVVVELRDADADPWLRVFADNHRGRRFYEKHGWSATGESTVSSFAPYPELLTYTLPSHAGSV